MRFFGEIGYGETAENPPDSGVWVDVITEKSYFGDVLRATRKSREGDQVNNDLSVDNSISIIADAFANENFLNIRYVVWQGKRWTVSSVEVERPRLILTLGGVYNGPTPIPAPVDP